MGAFTPVTPDYTPAYTTHPPFRSWLNLLPTTLPSAAAMSQYSWITDYRPAQEECNRMGWDGENFTFFWLCSGHLFFLIAGRGCGEKA